MRRDVPLRAAAARWLTAASRAVTWVRLERLCLCVLVLNKGYRLYARWGLVYGTDPNDQIEVTNLLGWGHMRLGLKQCFNCYQPPLGFLIPKIALAFGMHDVTAAELSSFVAYFVAFLLLRATLSTLGVLARPASIVFLYSTVAIPVSSYLALAITLDSFLYAWAAAILYTSVRLFWEVHVPPGRRRGRGVWAVLLVALLATAPLVKISGFTLCSIPVLVALVQRRGAGWRRRLALSVVPCAVAVALASPYFYDRYYKETGHFLVTNHEWRFQSEVDAGRAWRDEHPVRFFVEMLRLNPRADADPNVIDPERVRLHDWWRLYWVQPQFLGFAGEDAYRASRAYLAITPVLVLVGLFAFARRCRSGTIWSRLGWLFLLEGAVQLASMVRYLYVYPDALHVPVKPQYIAPFLWALAYALSGVASARGLFPYFLARRWRLGRQLLVVLVLFVQVYSDHLAIYGPVPP
jgi:hypothetical protein